MTKDEALQAVQEIRDESWDDEVAHSKEDSLRAAFIAFISERDDELGEIARIILSTSEMKFHRWCA